MKGIIVLRGSIMIVICMLGMLMEGKGAGVGWIVWTRLLMGLWVGLGYN